MPAEIVLGGLWRFKGFRELNGEELGAYLSGGKVDDWLLAKAPLTAHTNLMDNRLIPDPFMGVNEREVQWVNESEWWYRKEIELTQEIISKDVVDLTFECLDTFATIWVNDAKVGEANNMFTPWRFNIKQVAKPGKNVIAIRFKPASKVASEFEKQHKNKYTCLSSDNFSARPYVRKAQYSFGWDWGPTLPTAGIWGDVKVVAYNTAKIGYFSGLPQEVSEHHARVKLEAEIHASKETDIKVQFAFAGFNQNFDRHMTVKVTKGRNFAQCTVDVDEPKLWWPKGYGDANLYEASVNIFAEQELLDKASSKVGIRSITIVQEPDEEGETFVFKINGLKVFCKGANWIPADSFIPRVNYERYHKLVGMAADANFNMLRVWGGGVYEADEFYDLCDSLGIMVWQDFMYACAGYPEEESFLREVEREATETVLRLRGHPSIVLWCGNNENQWLQCVLWKDRDKVERLYGLQIYEYLLPRVSQTLDSTRPYRPSTPFGGKDSCGRHEGDRHNWEVWSQGVDYPAYMDDNGRFISEFGWQAPPTMRLLEAYLEKQDLNPNSFAFKAHEKQVGGLELLKALLSIHYPVPEDMKRFVLYGQLNQADALKTAVNYWRSRMFKTSGCLIWQLDDCWPVVSWSLIDYRANPKAAYFAVKRAYQSVIAPLILKGDRIKIFVINETAKTLEATLGFQVMTFNGEVLFNQEKKTVTSKYTSNQELEIALGDLPSSDSNIFVVTLQSSGALLYQDVRSVREPKDLKLPKPQLQLQVNRHGLGEFEIEVASDVYAKAVSLQLDGIKGQFSDNFLDILPNSRKMVKFTLEEDVPNETFEKALNAEAYPY